MITRTGMLLGVILAVWVVPAAAADRESFPNGREPIVNRTFNTALLPFVQRQQNAAPGTDTTYIGYSPGHATAANPWSIRASTGGAGVHKPPAAGCMWNFDPAGEASPNGFINGDSLQGWWPIDQSRRFMKSLLLETQDFEEPWCSMDFGNTINYGPRLGRTFGIVGAWHRDHGNNAAIGPANGVGWAPLQGNYSAWCGLRRQGDAQYVDNVTGQPINAAAAQFNINNRFSNPQNVATFPGYCDYWDQMLYRDIDMTSNPNGNLTLGFVYATKLSAFDDMLGWFDKDPLSVTDDGARGTCSPGNFISTSEPASTGLVDSFMVYIGAPTESTFQPYDDCRTGAPSRQPIGDPLRRWFDEVIEANSPTLFRELVSVTGDDPSHVASVTIPNATLAPMLAAGNGHVRLLFRVKTNSRGSDESVISEKSNGRGAAVIDNVTWSISGGASSPAGWGDFEASGSVDNTKSAIEAWRSTGKPTEVMGHRHVVNDAGNPYDDLCATDPGVTGSLCSANGGVLVVGDHDLGDRLGDPTFGVAQHAVAPALLSPTIQLRSSNGVWPNAIGIQAPGNPGDALGKQYFVDYEIYTAKANEPLTGVLFRWVVQSWPLLDGNGNKHWSNITRSMGNYQTDAICYRSLIGLTSQEGDLSSMLKFTPGASENPAYPDSIRIGVEAENNAVEPGVSDPNPIGGLFWDNISLVIVETPTPLPLTAQAINFYQDAFPWNPGVTEGYTSAFDTTGILVKTGLNIGPGTGLTSWDVPGDSIVVSANGAAPARVDLIFRILPGPGDYVTVGRPASGLAKNPQAPFGAGRTRVSTSPVASSTSFWESFMADNGAFGTPGGHGAGGNWNPNVWNSARMDTTEISVFAFQEQGITGGPVNFNSYMGSLHEAELGLGVGAGDPYGPRPVPRTGLGLPRHKCYLASPTAAAGDVDCVHAAGTTDGVTYDLTWVTPAPGTPNPATGFNGSDLTTEGTKIIPDGLLCPGAHVQYFFRLAQGGSMSQAALMPDTNVIVPQLGYGSLDARRWESFSALPDRWKDTGYIHPGGFNPGPPACMLVINNQDGVSGDEAAWVSLADTIGITLSPKWGAHNGWHAPGNIDISNPASPGFTSTFVSRNAGSAGSSWDLYVVRGAGDPSPAGSFGARYAFDNGPGGSANSQVYSKRQQSAPTLDQLKAFYRIIVVLSGDRATNVWGPAVGRSADDTQLLVDWLSSGDPVSPNRGLWTIGSSFVQGAFSNDPYFAQDQFIKDYLGADLQSGELRTMTGAPRNPTINLVATDGSPIDLYPDPSVAPLFGVRNLCRPSLDVLNVALGGVTPQTSVLTSYEDPNEINPPAFPAGILKVHAATKPWVAITEGWNLGSLGSQFFMNTHGRRAYVATVLDHVFPGFCPAVPFTDVPDPRQAALSDFVNVGNNPMVSGSSRIRFGLRQADLVSVQIFDIAGREVRLLAHRRFAAGEHDLVWDGTDGRGQPVARGVYFTQVRYEERGYKEARKITVLR